MKIKSTVVLVCFCLLISASVPVSSLCAQQRSSYDLAAWIIAAVDSYDTTSINWALKEGGQIDFKRGGMNALEMAIYYKKTAMVKFLLQKGASIDSVHQNGLNALQFAEKRGEPEIVELIKKNMRLTPAAEFIPVNQVPPPGTNTQNTDSISRLPSNAYPYKVGEKVLHSRDRGKTWEPGYIKDISTSESHIADGLSPYLVENEAKTSQNFLDINFITTFTRQPGWTSFFMGDWDLRLPIAATERIINRDVYQIISGGDRLPPLLIKADGTYSWIIDKTKIIKGRWIQNANSPGIFLLKGYRGIDWQVYNSSDSNNRKIFKTDYIIIADSKGKFTSSHGFRIVQK